MHASSGAFASSGAIASSGAFASSGAYADSGAHADSEAHATSEANAASEAHSSSSACSCPLCHHPQPQEVCVYGNVCGDEACLRTYCDKCKIIPFVAFFACECPKPYRRLYDKNMRPAECVDSNSKRCLDDAKKGASHCNNTLPYKPCMCKEKELCTMDPNDDSCAGMNCSIDSQRNNPRPKCPWCRCIYGYRRLACGKCVPENSPECKSLIFKSQHYCEKLRTVREPCRCDYHY